VSWLGGEKGEELPSRKGFVTHSEYEDEGGFGEGVLIASGEMVFREVVLVGR